MGRVHMAESLVQVSGLWRFHILTFLKDGRPVHLDNRGVILVLLVVAHLRSFLLQTELLQYVVSVQSICLCHAVCRLSWLSISGDVEDRRSETSGIYLRGSSNSWRAKKWPVLTTRTSSEIERHERDSVKHTTIEKRTVAPEAKQITQQTPPRWYVQPLWEA